MKKKITKLKKKGEKNFSNADNLISYVCMIEDKKNKVWYYYRY